MHRVVLREEGDQPIEIPLLLDPEEECLWLGEFIYPWEGEPKISYRVEDGLLFVDNKAIGVSLRDPDHGLFDPKEIVTITSDCSHMVWNNLQQFVNLKAICFTGIFRVEEFDLLENLQSLPRLKLLWFSWGNMLMDSALEYIGELHSLKVLGVPTAGITDEGLQRLKGCPDLRVLNLSQTGPFKGWGLGELTNLTQLKRLILSNTQINSDHLKYLLVFSALQELNLEGTTVDDNGVDYIVSLSNLQKLNLTNTKISRDGYSKVRNELPNCDIQ